MSGVVRAFSLTLLAWGWILTNVALAQELVRAQVAYVGDGDTIWLHSWLPDTHTRQRVRILGIDAPEICQTGGVEARDALRSQIQGKTVQLRMTQNLQERKDSYGRWLAQVQLLGERDSNPAIDVGQWMVEQGQAWAMSVQGQAPPYRLEQRKARVAKLGLWQNAETAMPPWRFRRINGACTPKSASGP
jgi:endonuclease YncB( thermonuclease family)